MPTTTAYRMKLEDYNKRSVLTTPDGYFEKLNKEIKSATCHKSKPKTKFLVSVMSYAAMVAVVFMVAAGLIYNRTDNLVFADSTNVAEHGETVYDAEFITNALDEYPIDEYTFYCYMTNTDNNY